MSKDFVNSAGGQLVLGSILGTVATPIVAVATETLEGAQFVAEEDYYACECRRERERKQRLRKGRVILVLEDR